jgi:starch synthase
MKILFLSRYQFPLIQSGGTGVVVQELMDEFENQNHKISHWTWNSGNLEKNITIKNMRGFSIIGQNNCVSPKFRNLLDINLTTINMLGELERISPFDIVHVHTWEMFHIGVLVKYLFNIPLVFTTHDIMVDDHPEEAKDSDCYQYSVLGEKIMMSEADGIVSISKQNKELLESYYESISDKVNIIHNGVNIKTFTPKETESFCEVIGVKKPYVLFLGRAVKAKGIEHVINAAKLIPEDISIVFAMSLKRWDGQEYDTSNYYLNMVSNLAAIRKNVKIILNNWDRNFIPQLYSNAAVTVMPSTYEPCGMVHIESQACGTPAIVGNIGFLKQSVKNNETGLIVDTLDNEKCAADISKFAINVCRNQDLRNEMRKKCRDYVVQNHSWVNRVQMHSKFYKKLIEKNTSKSDVIFAETVNGKLKCYA